MTTVEAVTAWIQQRTMRLGKDDTNSLGNEIICADTGPVAVGGVLACQTAPVTEPSAVSKMWV